MTVKNFSQKNSKAEKPLLSLNLFYKAGWCLFEGLFEHPFAVNPVIVDDFTPQYLQLYCFFSLPSYNSCFFPSGFFEHPFAVKPVILEDLSPHHLQ